MANNRNNEYALMLLAMGFIPPTKGNLRKHLDRLLYVATGRSDYPIPRGREELLQWFLEMKGVKPKNVMDFLAMADSATLPIALDRSTGRQFGSDSVGAINNADQDEGIFNNLGDAFTPASQDGTGFFGDLADMFGDLFSGESSLLGFLTG